MMKKTLLALMLALFAASIAGAQQIDIDTFYGELASYGEWIEIAPYGWVWSPGDVEVGWKPYSEGWWVYTDYGWTFQSDEPWAWAVYHYGRWTYDEDYGWVWVPGTDWGPAWVAWRYGDDYIGWAPLPPAVGWSARDGLIAAGFDFETGIYWTSWVFVQPRWFTAPRIRAHVVHPAMNKTILYKTKDHTRYQFVDRRVFNPGVPIKDAERFAGKKIPRQRIVETPKRGGGRPAKGNLPVYKPMVKDTRTLTPRDLPDRRKPMNPADVRRKQDDEKRKFTEYYEREKREIQPPPAPPRPNKVQPKDDPRQAVVDDKAKQLDEIQTSEKRVMDNKQRRELDKLKKKPNP